MSRLTVALLLWAAPAQAGRKAQDTTPDLRLSQVRELGGQRVAVSPSGGLAIADGVNIREEDPRSGETRAFRHGEEIRDLRYGPEGRLWVLDRLGVSAYEDGIPKCKAELPGERLLRADTRGVEVGGRTWPEGEPAAGVRTRVDPGCSVRQEPPERPVVSSTVALSGMTWIGRNAPEDAQGAATGPPSLEVRPAGSVPVGPWPVLAGTAERVLGGLAATETRALVVGREGAWELWRLPGPRRVAAGRSDPGVQAVIGGAFGAVGSTILRLETGEVATTLPGLAVAATPDGTWWVLRSGGSQGLWQAR